MNAINAQIEKAILNLAPSVSIGSLATNDEVKGIIRTFLRKHPEIFWLSHNYTYTEDSGIVKFIYNFTKEEIRFINGEIEKVLKKDFQVDYVRNLSELEKLVYVYKWIAKRTTYNEYSSYNQTIYSVLINRNSVCTGYAKTAQYLLSQVGINSKLVYGKFNCDKSELGRHSWNIVQINGIWYHVDFCLAEASLSNLINEDECLNLRDSLLWNYFGVSTKAILTNRTIEDIETIPNCDSSIINIPDITLKAPAERLICCKSDSGSTSRVYLDSFDKNVVIKIPRDNKNNLIENEAYILRELNGCQHIVKLIFANDRELGLEQLTPWGELLNSTYYNPSDSTLRAIIHQLITGLLECKQKGICYSDIHYNNVFVSSEGIYKWGDFGLAFSAQEWNHLPKILFENGMPKGSQWFMAPETYYSGIFNEASAIYAVSMMAYFVMNDMRPPFWSGVDHQIDALKERFDGHEIPMPTNASRYRSLWPIIVKNLSFDISKRDQSFLELLHQLQKASNDENIHFDDYKGNNVIAASNLENCSLDTFAQTANISVITQDLDFDENINADEMCNADIDMSDNFESHKSDYVSSIEYYASTNACPISSRPNITQSSECISEASEICQNSFRPSSYSAQHGAHNQNSRHINIMQRFKDKLIGLLKSTDEKSAESDEINACVYAPAQIKANKSFIIRVYLYKSEEADVVDSKVKEIDPIANKKEYKPLDFPVKYDDVLTVQLKMSGCIRLDENTKSIKWRNHYSDCSFMAMLIDKAVSDVYGKAYISVNGIPAGELLFTIDVVETQEKKLYANVESHKFSRIFISYSHLDELQVKGFAECCRAIGTDYFFDRHTLHTGDIFKDKIFNYIHNADLFVLCWSENAAHSEWVQIEREYALSLIKNGETKLSIYPLSLKPEAPLPIDMIEKYNFGTL
jgi:serine/threonine protein kinase